VLVTPARAWQRRREFVRAALASGLIGAVSSAEAQPAGGQKLATRQGALSTMEKTTRFELVTNYCNFYEFGTDKEDLRRGLVGSCSVGRVFVCGACETGRADQQRQVR
jgi:sulfoxide reductase catalytic subunit YedY